MYESRAALFACCSCPLTYKREIEINHHRSAAKTFSSSGSNESYAATDQSGKKKKTATIHH
jgi:hypothetical protein